jgi:plastocyanin
MTRSTRTGAATVVFAIACTSGSCFLYPPIPVEYEGGVSGDAGTLDGEVVPVFNGCTPGMYVDRSAADADRTVGFAGANGSDEFGYSPACIVVAAGQAVTFIGTFAVHPLSPGISPIDTDAGVGANPIPETASGAMLTVTFPAPGTFPYYCEMHYATGMYGVVHVR